MRFRLMLILALLVLAGFTVGPNAQSSRFEAQFGILEKNGTCPEATHLLRYPCPDSGHQYYLVFPKGHEDDAARFLDQNVAIRGTLKGSACSLPLVQVTTIEPSSIVPPCVYP